MKTTIRRRLKLPLVDCAHESRPGEEMTPDRVADVLLEEEAEAGFPPSEDVRKACCRPFRA